MSASELTGRERVLRMLERRDHDRIPRQDRFWPETIKRWQREGFQGDGGTVLRLLRSDFASVCWTWPVPFPGRNEVLSDDGETVVARGNMGKVERRWKNKSGTPEHIEFGCDSRQKWEREYKPALLKAGRSVKPDQAAKSFAEHDAAGKFISMSGIESFEAMRQLVGDEILLTAFAAEPDWVRDMSQTYTDLILWDFEAVLAAGARPHAVYPYGDLAYKNGPFFSPAMYRDLLWPDHKRLRDWARARGLKLIFHTDGDVRPLIPLFIEAGFDCIEPMEAKAGMDVRQLAPIHGRRLSFFGNIDMTVAITGDKARLEHEVRTKLAAGMANKGYAYLSDHSVPPQVSWDTYQCLIGLLDRYGHY